MPVRTCLSFVYPFVRDPQRALFWLWAVTAAVGTRATFDSPTSGATKQLVLGAQTGWQRARCCAQLFEAISQSFNYYRKQQLVQWALALQRRLHAGVASHCELEGAEGGQAQGTERPGTPHPAPRARA